jgi:MFS superfamily sulfate permease-like transporter
MFSLKACRVDLFSGFFVAMLALPLSLGIAAASGFPPVAGLITAIIGGLFGALVSGAPLTIKGPAAGLIVLALGAVQKLSVPGVALSGYRRTLAVIVVAGLVQVLLSRIKFSRVVSLIPASVIHGMLAAIGIIVISKQLPVMLGLNMPSGLPPLESLVKWPLYLESANPLLLGLGAIALLVMVASGWLKRFSVFQYLPVPLIIVIAAITTSMFFGFKGGFSYIFNQTNFEVTTASLVNLPLSFLDSIVTPDWSAIFSAASIEYIVMFALVGSVESLLTVSAVESLQSGTGAVTRHDRDLMGLGVANVIAGLIGGLPMISEVTRSKANLDTGAKSSASNFLHGLFLLIFVVFLPGIISSLPLACLAAMLVYVGFRLASPHEFRSMWKIGPEQFCFFVTTCLVTLLTDLLMGVCAGLLMAYVFAAFHAGSLINVFRLRARVKEDDSSLTVRVNGPATFLNCQKLSKHVAAARSRNKSLQWDFSHANLVDYTFLSKIDEVSKKVGVTGSMMGLHSHARLSNHPQCSRVKNRFFR